MSGIESLTINPSADLHIGTATVSSQPVPATSCRTLAILSTAWSSISVTSSATCWISSTREVWLDDGEHGHQRWKIANGARVGCKWSALPTRTAVTIALDAPNGYSDGQNRQSSGNVG